MSLTDEQRALRELTRELLDNHSSEERIREVAETDLGVDLALWRRLANTGLIGLAIPDELGGSGQGIAELAVVMTELGRSLAPVPYLVTTGLVVPLLAQSPTTEAVELISRIIAGETVVTIAVTEGRSGWLQAPPATTATPDSDHWKVTGTKRNVLDATAADVHLVIASTDRGADGFLVDTAQSSVTVENSLDPTRRLATIGYDHAPAVRLELPVAPAAIARVRDHALVLLGAEQVGIAERTLDLAVGYAKIREQFGRPIGGFQAIRHLCADLVLQVESARAAVAKAIDSADSADFPSIARIVAITCGRAAMECATGSLQVHGGVGYTWEHPLHLYLKRARLDAVILGDRREHLLALADLAAV